MKRILIAFVLFVLVAAVCGGLVWFNFFRDRMVAQFFANFPIPTVTVSTVEVEPQRWTPGIDAVGTVSAAEGVDVAGQVSGVVKSILFKANDEITAGEVLVELDDSVERATLLSAESTVSVAEDALRRTQDLFDKTFATSADLEAAKNRVAIARGALSHIEANLAQRSIRSPFSGTIGIPQIDVGQYLQAGSTIATLQNLDSMRVDFTVPEQQLADLEIGQPASIGLTADRLDLEGAITGIDPKIDPDSRLVSVQAVVGNDDTLLRPGRFVRVRVHLPEEDNVIALPQTAVVLSLYGSYVYEVVEAPAPAAKPPAGDEAASGAVAATPPEGQDGGAPAAPTLVAKQIFVQTGRRSDTEIEILKGVEPGMKIVSSGQNKLSNGSHVVIDNSVNPVGESRDTAEARP